MKKLTAGDIKRKQLFEKFSSNLADVLRLHNGALGYKNEQDEFQMFSGKSFICPLCIKRYEEEECFPNEKNEIFLSLEHNPPKSLGGKISVLTCNQCNTKQGAENDHHLKKYLFTNEFLQLKPGSSIPVTYSLKGKSIKGNLSVLEDKTMLIDPSKNSNPLLHKIIFDDLKSKEFKEIQFSFTVPKEDVVNYIYLKMAHLKAFEYLGYNYLLNYSGLKVAEVLRGKNEYPMKYFGRMLLEIPNGDKVIHVITHPVELSAMIITLPLVVKKDGKYLRKNTSVILPGPDEKGWNGLNNFNRFINQSISFKTISQNLNVVEKDNTAYYNIFK